VEKELNLHITVASVAQVAVKSYNGKPCPAEIDLVMQDCISLLSFFINVKLKIYACLYYLFNVKS